MAVVSASLALVLVNAGVAVLAVSVIVVELSADLRAAVRNLWPLSCRCCTASSLRRNVLPLAPRVRLDWAGVCDVVH